MSRVFIGARVLQLPTGGYTRLFTKDDENAAKQAIQQADQDFRTLLGAQLVFVGPDGKARHMGMSFAQALGSLGIAGIGYAIEEAQVEGMIQPAPTGRLIITG